MSNLHPVLVADSWRTAASSGEFHAWNPETGEPRDERFPVSQWSDLDEMLSRAGDAAQALRRTAPEKLAGFLDDYAARIESDASAIAETAAGETGLPVSPRLRDTELPRTVNQLRQAGAAAREGSWAMPTIDTRLNIRSHLAPLGPVWCIGPNNFPLAYNGISGGDFASAIAAGNPVIAKSHPCHPATTARLARHALAASQAAGLPPGTVQLFWHCSPEDGLRMARDRRLGAIGFTGGRHSGLALKAAADSVGKPIYLEMSSINPVVLLPGALEERRSEIVQQFCTSCLMAAGQFCTNPGLVLMSEGAGSDAFIPEVAERFAAAPPGTLLSSGVRDSLVRAIGEMTKAGATLLVGGKAVPGPRWAVENTLLRISGDQFLANPDVFQAEMFGAASLMVVAAGLEQVCSIIERLEGNLTGSIYWSQQGTDDAACRRVTDVLRPKVGRLLHDRMPTGVAVTAAMNHGGPFPATGHPGFTAVGFPIALRRFAALHCYDNVRASELPPALADHCPNPDMLRLVDGMWMRGQGPCSPPPAGSGP